MKPGDLIAYRRQEPFQPFRVHLEGGQVYDVGRPEVFMVGQSRVHIGIDLNENDLPREIVWCRPEEIVRIELVNNRTLRSDSDRQHQQ